MKTTDYTEPMSDEGTACLAEEFIGLDGVGEFPEWRSSDEEEEDEASIQTRRIA